MNDYKIGEELTDDEVREYAQDFSALVRTPEWAAFCALVAVHEDRAAHQGHFDDEQPTGYYRGYLTALKNLRETPQMLVDRAQAIESRLQREAEVSERLRLKQPLPEGLLEPLDDGARILRFRSGAGSDDEAYL